MKNTTNSKATVNSDSLNTIYVSTLIDDASHPHVIAARAAGRAWAQREWDALEGEQQAEQAASATWLPVDADALPLVAFGPDSDVDNQASREAELAEVCNAAAAAEWTALCEAWTSRHEDDEPATTDVCHGDDHYTLRDDAGGELEITADDIDDAKEQAREWARDGDWDTSMGTIWIDVVILQRGERIARVTEAIQPTEPDCVDDEEHEWIPGPGGLEENPGVFGHGGGVVIVEVCRHCGVTRITDTWAQRGDTGEQGLTSVRYEESEES